MKIGDEIYSSKTSTTYTICNLLSEGGKSLAGIVTSSATPEKLYFIKLILDIKYPINPALFSEERFLEKRKVCDAYYHEKEIVYNIILQTALPGSSLNPIVDFFRDGTFYYTVSEYIDNVTGSTKDIFCGLNYYEKILVLKTIAYALHLMHKNNIVHGDLKPQNILIKSVERHYMAKIIDIDDSFFACFPPESITHTEPYCSPELSFFMNDRDRWRDSVTTKTDIFSLGIIFIELLSNILPILPPDKYDYAWEAIVENEKLELYNSIPQQFHPLIYSMICRDYKKRPSAYEVFLELKRLEYKIVYFKDLYDIKIPIILITRDEKKEVFVTIEKQQEEGQIHYTTDGSIPTSKSSVFKNKFKIEICLIVKAVLIINRGDQEYCSSIAIKTAKKSLFCIEKVLKPTIVVSGGIAKIECDTSDSIIYYTVDGKFPDTNSIRYIGSFMVEDYPEIIAYAVKDDMLDSEYVHNYPNSKLKMK